MSDRTTNAPEHLQQVGNSVLRPSRIRAYFRTFFFGRGVQKSIFVRSGSKSVFRTHKYHQNARNFETNPMGLVPGSETHISRKKSFNFLIGARILLGETITNLTQLFILPHARMQLDEGLDLNNPKKVLPGFILFIYP